MEGKKVLVVDDELHIVHVVAIKLRSNGFEVLTAGNGADAYELACSGKPDIIVTDLQMPVMDGWELVDKIRQNEQLKFVPVIMLTGRSFSIDKERMAQLRIIECIGKPFSPRELLQKIESILSLNPICAQ
jgi:two-component system alkaline phosphatase synthesis response regulator PhoP